MRNIDKFQIVGFILSAVISIVLVIRGQDTVSSVTLGLSLAIITQLFDLQMRNAESEKKILRASLLDYQLFDDQELLTQITQIV